ncbi:hypothetical protein IJR75_02380 [bacterium]|nr:hypothetical protein [bacterium]
MVKHLEYMFRNHDQFYTTTNCVSFVLNKSFSFLRKNKIKIDNKNIFVEPSAGTGSFVKYLQKKNFSNIEAYDIEPKYSNVRRKNFFDLKLKFNKKIIVIGNPPFGYKSKMAIEFII